MTLTSGVQFTLPESLIASEPAEVRTGARDGVRLMVAHGSTRSIEHEGFASLVCHLHPGDVLVVNTSRTLPAAIDAVAEDGRALVLHFASPTSEGLWSVEVRTETAGGGTRPGPDLSAQTLTLSGGLPLHLLAPNPRTPRLWIAALEDETDLARLLTTHGRPIRYVDGPSWPLEHYQTVFAGEPGSAEMPSAARPFTPDLVTELVSHGVVVVPVILHTGVSSYEAGEFPGEEKYDVPPVSANVINALRRAGGRVVAVGTTVVRALETVADESGAVHPGRGVTDLVVNPERGVFCVDGLLTGWHEPRSSHLSMLETFVPASFLQEIYDTARSSGYRWHEFGDELLILP